LLLEGKVLTKRFGGLVALNEVSFRIERGEIIGLIGPNGAGKTTLFNVVTGILRADGGRVELEGKDITNLKPYERCHLGVVKTFQTPNPFLELTVLDNCAVGVLFGRGKGTSLAEARRKALGFLEFVGLKEVANEKAANLTLMGRRMLEIAGALATNPKVILLDEVLAGLNPTEVNQSLKIIREARERFNVSIFWIEHVMKAIMKTAEKIVVLHHGRKIAEGKPEEITTNVKVIEAYLGGAAV